MKLDEILNEADWSDVIGGKKRSPQRDGHVPKTVSGRDAKFGRRHVSSEMTDRRLQAMVVGSSDRDYARAEAVGAANADHEIAMRVYVNGPKPVPAVAEYVGGNVMGLASFASEQIQDIQQGEMEPAVRNLKSVVSFILGEMPKIRARIRKGNPERGMQSANWEASEEVAGAVEQLQRTMDRSIKALTAVRREGIADDPAKAEPPGGGLSALARSRRGSKQGFNDR